MEFGKVRLLVLIVAFLAITSVYSLKCYVGEAGGDLEDIDCYDDTIKYCVKYVDYTFSDTYFFCDYVGQCKQPGVTNTSTYEMTCCTNNECNKP